jgi:hypothetical protein
MTIPAITRAFQEILPPHKCGLYLNHNAHRDYYETVTQWIEHDENLPSFFENPEAMARSIAADEVWDLQWYPDTPIGFHRVLAPTLHEAMALAVTQERPA